MITNFKYLILSITLVIYCSCTVSVPKSRIPEQAWRPGDIGRVKRKIYVEKAGEDLILSNTNRYELAGVLNAGDLVRITRCIDYPLSTTGGTYLELQAISGGMRDLKFTNGIIFDYVLDSEGEAYAIPDPKIMERIYDVTPSTNQ